MPTGFYWDTFHFQSPWALALLLLIPLLILVYWYYQRKRIIQGIRFSYSGLMAELKLQPVWWKRLLPPILALSIVFLLILSLAKPSLSIRRSMEAVDMMLVMDISLSMMAEDITPDRLTAAKRAAIRFIDSLPEDAQIGLAYFAGDVYIAQAPTRNHQLLVDSLARLTRKNLQTNTQIGDAIQGALLAFRELDTRSQKSQVSPNQPAAHSSTLSDNTEETLAQPRANRVIVLMSDGDSTGGYPWMMATDNARQSNVTIHTIGIGSEQPTEIFFMGEYYPVFFNESTLKTIAQRSGGQYFRVFREEDFRKVYDSVRQKTLHYETVTQDLSQWTTGLALALLLCLFAFNLTLGRRFP